MTTKSPGLSKYLLDISFIGIVPPYSLNILLSNRKKNQYFVSLRTKFRLTHQWQMFLINDIQLIEAVVNLHSFSDLLLGMLNTKVNNVAKG